MAATYWMVFQGPAAWWIGRVDAQGHSLAAVPIADDTTGDDIAAALAQALAAQGYVGDGIVLGLDSCSCLIGNLKLESPARSRSRQALLYQLEEVLPVAAEEVVADFVFEHRHALGVAVETAAIAPLVDGLERRGVKVQCITPIALLALQHVAVVVGQEGPQLVLWDCGERLELFAVLHGKPANWQTLFMEPELLGQHLGMLALGHATPPRLTACSLSEGMRQTLSHVPDLQFEERESPAFLDAAALAAADIQAGKCGPFIDLRRDALATRDRYRPVRGPLRVALSAAAVALLALTGSLLFRAQRYEQQARAFQQQQAEAFQEALPGQPLPLGIRSRLESEYARLAGLRGGSVDLPANQSALTVLHHVLAGLPGELRYRIVEIRVEQGRVHLEGEVRAHADADQIAAGLRQRGFDVSPPQTQLSQDQTVAVRISAELPRVTQ